MNRKWVICGAVFAGLISSAVILLAVWLNTESGLQWTIRHLMARADISLSVGSVEGRLLGPITLRRLQYGDLDNGPGARLEQVRLDWRPAELLQRRLSITELTVAGVDYHPGAGQSGDPVSLEFLKDLSLPVTIAVNRFNLENLRDVTRVGELISGLSGKAELDSQRLNVEELEVRAPGAGIEGAEFSLELQDHLPLQGSLDWRLGLPGMSGFEGALQVNGELEQALRPSLTIEAPFSMTLDGTVSDLLSSLQWQLNADIPGPVSLNEVSPALPALAVQGKVAADGDLDGARLRPELRLQFEEFLIGLQAGAEINRESLRVHDAEVTLPESRGLVGFSGTLDLAELSWRLDASIPEPLSLPDIHAELPDLVAQGSVAASGDLTTARLKTDLEVQFKDFLVALDADAEVSREMVRVRDAGIELLNQPGAVRLSGKLGLSETWPFELAGEWTELQSPGPDPWISPEGRFDTSGDLEQARASLSGSAQPPDGSDPSEFDVRLQVSELQRDPSIVADVNLPFVSYQSVVARDVRAAVSIASAGKAESSVTLTAAEARRDDELISNLEAALSGTQSLHQLNLKLDYREHGLAAGFSGSLEGADWRGRIDALSVSAPDNSPAGSWRLEAPAPLTVSPSAGELGLACFLRQSARACAQGDFADLDHWALDVSVEDLPLTWLVPEVPEALELKGELEAGVALESVAGSIKGSGEATLNDAATVWRGEETIAVDYKNVGIKASVDESRAVAEVTGETSEGGVIRGQFETGDPLEGDGALQGTLALELPDLRIIELAFPDLGLRGGRIGADLSFAGTRRSPRISGGGELVDSALELAVLGVRLDPLSVSFDANDDGEISVLAEAVSGEGTIDASASFELGAAGGLQGEGRIKGEGVELVNLPEALVIGNPDLSFALSPARGAVTGKLDIASAELTPEAAMPGVTLSNDIVVVSEEEAASADSPLDWSADVIINLGDDVSFEGWGIRGDLEGALELNALPARPVTARGEIRVENGHYRIFDRELSIETGRLIYTGGILTEPGVDVAVVREINDVRVTLAVRGSLQEPDIQLDSTPPLDDTDKMSYLLVGRPAADVSQSDRTLLLSAAASLLPGGQQGLRDNVQSTLGLDTLDFNTNPDGDEQGSQVVLGKYVTPRLYLSYAVGFRNALDVFTARYELTRHWLLRTESSIRESTGDIVFTWSR